MDTCENFLWERKIKFGFWKSVEFLEKNSKFEKTADFFNQNSDF